MSGSSAPRRVKGSGSRTPGILGEFQPDLKYLNKHRADNSLTQSMATNNETKGSNKATVGQIPLLLWHGKD